jgi:hypothetical protein
MKLTAMAIIINEKKNVLKTWQVGLAYIKYNPLGPNKRFVICPGPNQPV